MSKVMESKGMENSGEEEFELRRGPWTVEEDKLLIHYISFHGEGRWNLLAKCSGLKRTGKSCRLRWLNYLKPDTKRGNLTPHEQILILELHSKWGNRWSKIAQHLPGRTDNEIKNYWRTRVQKQARQLNIDSNSSKFLEALRRFWMPRLLEKMDQSSSSSTLTMDTQASTTPSIEMNKSPMVLLSSPQQTKLVNNFSDKSISNEHANTVYKDSLPNESYYVDNSSFDMEGSSHHDLSAVDSSEISISGCQMAEIDWINDDVTDSFWNMDELLQLRK